MLRKPPTLWHVWAEVVSTDVINIFVAPSWWLSDMSTVTQRFVRTKLLFKLLGNVIVSFCVVVFSI